MIFNTWLTTLVRRLFIILFSVGGLVGCIQEIEIFKGSNPVLVVDGQITNEVGPHKVKLSYSKTYNTRASYEKIEGADVRIVDDLGNDEKLTYSQEGVYLTSPEFTGEIGRSYHVKIILRSGEQFQSKPETLNAAPNIELIRYVKNDVQLDFYVDFQDNVDEENYYRWRYTGLYEVMAPVAYEMSRTNQTMKNSDCIRWDGVLPKAKDIWQCWVTEFDNEYLQMESDLLFNGKLMKDFRLFSKEIDQKFDRGYWIEVKQYSLTKSAFEYWKAIEEQMNNNGTIFETNNYQIKGNIISADADDVVLGYFSASAVSQKSTFVFDYMGLFGPVTCETNNSGCYPERCMDCRKFAANSTNIKPSVWPY